MVGRHAGRQVKPLLNHIKTTTTVDMLIHHFERQVEYHGTLLYSPLQKYPCLRAPRLSSIWERLRMNNAAF
jgi:hypothetical protein